ncbi:chromatin remodeling complex subunit [Purpureocillium lavendulum]|uniref:Chromatin remodeling complex subunit n=1 Tax=Purpureocillium lavendulum TaxID=1247861 RepID=A0AB34FYN2_9HYPO|nr:chromatin remodeling complex subunit [Purpureocillium lavendulum]
MTRSDSGEDEANLKDGDCQIPLAGKRDMANKRLVQAGSFASNQEHGAQSTTEKYWQSVHPFMPFVPAEMLEETKLGRHPDLQHCVDLASRLSFNLMDQDDDITPRMQQLLSMLRQGRLSMSAMAGVLLLIPYILERVDTLGAQLALRPVPGVLLFLCALARSTFICPRELLDRWALLVNMQAATVRIMLRLWKQTGFENCRALCNLWEDSKNLFPDLKQQVREEIGSGPWAIEEIDGYSVFWTFRDVRTLTTKFIIDSRT